MYGEFGKRDIVFLSALFLLGLALTFFIYHFSAGGSEIHITVDGELYGVYGLRESQEITVESGSGVNVVVIENGGAHMKSADCPDSLCVHQGRISRDGQTIVCLPHRLIVTIEGGQGNGVDGAAG